MAGDIAGAVDAAMSAVDAIGALANASALDAGNLLQPIQQATDRLSALAPQFQQAMQELSAAFTAEGGS
jgi:hypothetical protein